MDKKYIVMTFLNVSALLLITASAFAAEKVRFATATRVSPPYYLVAAGAEEKGFWKQNGLEVEWIPFTSAPAMDRALAARAIDMGLTMAPTVFQTKAARVPITIVAQLHGIDDFFIWVPAGSPINETKDLKGARIGTSAIGGLTHTYGRLLVRALGMEKDIRFVGTGGLRETVAALKTGAIDGSLTAFYLVAELKAKGELREVIRVNDYFPKEWTAHVVISHEEFAKRNPEAVKKALRAIFQTVDFVEKNPAWPVAKIKSESRFSDEVARIVYERLRFSKDGKVSKEGLENLRNFLIEYGVLTKEKAPSTDEMYWKELSG